MVLKVSHEMCHQMITLRAITINKTWPTTLNRMVGRCKVSTYTNTMVSMSKICKECPLNRIRDNISRGEGTIRNKINNLMAV